MPPRLRTSCGAAPAALLLAGHPARHKIADALRQDSDAVAPAHLDAEVLSALRGRMFGGHLSPAELRAGVSTPAAMPVRRVPLDDAIHLALASLTSGVLVTGDAALAGAARRAKTPRQHIDCSA